MCQEVGLCRLQVLHLLINALHRQSHHIEITAVDMRHANVAYPFLNAVGSCLVQRSVMFYIIIYLAVGKFFEGHVGHHAKRLLAFSDRKSVV